MSSRSNRLFSEFVPAEDLNEVNYFSYFSCVRKGEMLTLLPSDHCLYYPLSFNTSTKEIKRGVLNFFNKILYEKYTAGRELPDTKYSVDQKSAQKQKVLFINLIDNCYGHTFLKLLNLYAIYRQYQNEFDLWVITPAAVEHFVPADKFYKAVVSLGFNDAMNCYSLAPLLSDIKDRYRSFDFVTLDTYSEFDSRQALVDFFPFLDSAGREKKYVTFYYRSDYFRTWGGTGQNKCIASFFEAIKPYFQKTEFVVVGDKDDFRFPSSFIDKRTNAFGREVDLAYNGIFSDSHFVVGLIGSNMLQPSMFCDFTIHLVPRSKTSIVAEEILNADGPAIQNWFNNIYLFGNENLSDLTPAALAEKTVVFYMTYLAKCYKKEIFEDRNFGSGLSQQEYIARKYPFFDYAAAMELKNSVTDQSFRYNLWRYRVFRVLKKLKIYS